MATGRNVDFTCNGSHFVQSSVDGTIKLWDTTTGNLSQEYVPSSHLSATCTCLAWHPGVHRDDSAKKKKKLKKSSSHRSHIGTTLSLIAVGTTSGDVLLYSFVKGDLHTRLTGGHGGAVNDVSWQRGDDVLYSCSDDQHVVEWKASTSSVVRKWKADKSRVTSLCVCHGDRHLLTAGRKIKLWDLEKEEVLKTFTGHSSQVMRLIHISNVTTLQSGDNFLTRSYFLSAAEGDRVLNVWHTSGSSGDKTALATLALDDEPTSLDVRLPTQPEEPFCLCVVTKSGKTLVFEHTLNGRCKKPLQPKSTISVATDDEKSRLVSVIAVKQTDDVERSVVLVHGNVIKPVFEKLSGASLSEDQCLIRPDPSKSHALRADGDVTDTKVVETCSGLTVSGPAHMTPALPSRPDTPGEGGGAKRKRRKSTELSLGERLHAAGVDQAADSHRHSRPPQADTLATLLAQGLQSNDQKIINSVLQNRSDAMIRNTVRRLPTAVVVPLVQELTQRMAGHAQSGRTLVKWIRTVLTIHTAYLMTFPDLMTSLGALYQMMESRVALFGRLSKLQGKLDLMLSQITSQTEEDEDAVTAQPAMLVYQDESSDDELPPLGAMGGVADTSEAEDYDDDRLSGDDASVGSTSDSDDDDFMNDEVMNDAAAAAVENGSEDSNSMDDDDEG